VFVSIKNLHTNAEIKTNNQYKYTNFFQHTNKLCQTLPASWQLKLQRIFAQNAIFHSLESANFVRSANFASFLPFKIEHLLKHVNSKGFYC